MNEITEKFNLIKTLTKYFKKNLKFVIGVIIAIVILIIGIQIFKYINNQKILNTSIDYNKIKSNENNSEFESSIIALSSEKNFYGILATFDKIKIKINNNELDSAYIDYLFLLNKKNLNNLYKSAIAIHASYSLLEKINLNEDQSSILLQNLVKNIKNLTSFVDNDITSYEGFKLEILYLISIIDQRDSKNSGSYKKTDELYLKIQENEKISNALKERVKKINDYQKYK